MVLRVFIISLSIMISACSSSVKNIKNDHNLKKGNGLFLSKLRTNYPIHIALKNSSDEILWLNENPLRNNTGLIMVSLPAGKYSLHQISWKNKESTFSKGETYEFLMRDGKVNYICDLGVYFKLKSEDIKSAEELKFVLPVYSKQRTYNEFKKTYPNLYKKYPFVSSLISNCVRGQSERARQLIHLLDKNT